MKCSHVAKIAVWAAAPSKPCDYKGKQSIYTVNDCSVPTWALFFTFSTVFNEFMIWATVSSWSYFCLLCRASPSLAAKNIINLISVLTIWTVQKRASCDGPGRSVAERSYPSPKVRSSDQECQAATAQEQPRGATPCARSGGCARAERSYSTSKVRRGVPEEISLAQGKEQQLHFAGAAVKRYTTTKVRETQVRQ